MLNSIDAQFHQLYANILNYGHPKRDRTGVGTMMLPAMMMRFDCSGGQMPLLSTRLVRHINSFHEMEMFKSGNPSIKPLCDRKIGLWDSWFIPGTAVYADARLTALSTTQRAQKMVDDGRFSELNDFFTNFSQSYPSWHGNSQLQVITADGNTHVWRALPDEAFNLLNAHLDSLDIPRNIQTQAAEPVSLAKRLTRVSKNDTVKWTVLHPRLVEGSYQDLEGGVPETAVKVTGFDPVEEKFKEFYLLAEAVPTIHHHLDLLQVPANRLLDASIGQGSYGVQWRKWQDTQLIEDSRLVQDYVKQGYDILGWLASDEHELPGGVQIAHREIDQLQLMIDRLQNDPDDRRMIVSAWNPGRLWQAALAPCHLYFQVVSWEFNLSEMEQLFQDRKVFQEFLDTFRNEDGRADFGRFATEEDQLAAIQAFAVEKGLPTRGITMFVLLRSSDAPLGAVFNVAQYAYLLHSIGNVVNMEPCELITIGVDCHIYQNQISAIEELLELGTDLENDPRIRFKRKLSSIDDMTPDDVEIVGYVPGPDIKIPVAV